MSMEQFADAVGVSWQSVQQWERGKTAPKRTRLQKVAEVIGVSAVSLLSEDDGLSPHTLDAPAQPATALGPDAWTVEQLMSALAEKLIAEAHPADVEAAPSDLKRIIEKARDPDARIQMSTTRQLLPDRRQANSGRQR